jgi:hypothetical protein
MASEVQLLGGDSLNGFKLPCAVKTSACIANGPGAKSGTVTLLPGSKQVQCCRPCFDAKLASGEWLFNAPKKVTRPAYEADPAPQGSEELKAAFERLVAFKKKFAGEAVNNADAQTKMSLRAEPGGIAIKWFGWYESELLDDLFTLVATKDVAPQVSAIEITGEAAGVNGTRNWNLKYLVAEGPLPKLARLVVEGTRPGDHNHSIIGNYSSEERGVLGALLDKAPALEHLEVPSAPGASFFKRESHGLRRLVIQTGYAHQGFIEALARSTCFPSLETLDFTDSMLTTLEDFESKRTPAASYEALLAATGLPALTSLTLRGTKLTAGDAGRLRATALGKRLGTLSIVG